MDNELPPLPEPAHGFYAAPMFTEAQMRAYAAAAVAAAADRIEADAALLRQALEALQYHVEQTRPIQQTSDTIAAIRARLEPDRP